MARFLETGIEVLDEFVGGFSKHVTDTPMQGVKTKHGIVYMNCYPRARFDNSPVRQVFEVVYAEYTPLVLNDTNGPTVLHRMYPEYYWDLATAMQAFARRKTESRRRKYSRFVIPFEEFIKGFYKE